MQTEREASADSSLLILYIINIDLVGYSYINRSRDIPTRVETNNLDVGVRDVIMTSVCAMNVCHAIRSHSEH